MFDGWFTLVGAYAPTLTWTAESKDEFYANFSVISIIPSKENIFILGDFSARVGVDHNSWPSCLGHFGFGMINENGQHLLEFCSYHGLCLTNTYFNMKPQHKVSWCHPCSKHWHHLLFQNVLLEEHPFSASEKTCCPRWIQVLTQWEVLTSSQSWCKQGTTDCKALCKWILATAQQLHPVCSCFGQHQRNISRHQDNSRSNTEQNSPP